MRAYGFVWHHRVEGELSRPASTASLAKARLVDAINFGKQNGEIPALTHGSCELLVEYFRKLLGKYSQGLQSLDGDNVDGELSRDTQTNKENLCPQSNAQSLAHPGARHLSSLVSPLAEEKVDNVSPAPSSCASSGRTPRPQAPGPLAQRV